MIDLSPPRQPAGVTDRQGTRVVPFAAMRTTWRAATTSRRTYATSMSPRCQAPRAVPATSYRHLR